MVCRSGGANLDPDPDDGGDVRYAIRWAAILGVVISAGVVVTQIVGIIF